MNRWFPRLRAAAFSTFAVAVLSVPALLAARGDHAPWPGVGAAYADDAPGKEGTLEYYMNTVVKPAMKGGDAAKVKKALEPVPGWAPEAGWNEGDKGWKAIVGAALKPSGNLGKACKSCHDAWQKDYEAKYGDRLLPK